MFTREEFENLINNSPLFVIDKESLPALYKTERYNFLTLLTEYYQTYIYPKKPLEDYSLTLMETAAECIKYYDKDKGEFLHLFNSALKRDLHIAKAKEIVEEKRQGIRVASEDDKLIRKIMVLANSKGLDIYNSIVQEKLAKVVNIDLDKLKELIRINDDAVAVASTVTNEDGDEIELFDLQASKEKMAEENLVEESSVISLLEEIEDVFSEVQDRQKMLLSMLLTAEVIKAFNEDVDKVKELLCDKEFYNEKVIEHYEQKGELLSAREISTLFGVSEQSASRTFKNFKEKLK